MKRLHHLHHAETGAEHARRALERHQHLDQHGRLTRQHDPVATDDLRHLVQRTGQVERVERLRRVGAHEIGHIGRQPRFIQIRTESSQRA